eukprot:6177478-Pleurochrysis_carterae.AAC.1
MGAEARRQAMARHTGDICAALSAAKAHDWLPACFMLALKRLGMFDEVMSTRVVADVKFNLVKDLLGILQAEWGVPLAIYLRTEVQLSDRAYEKLRLALCKRFDSATSLWVKRPWYRCAITGRSISLPEPLVSRYRWFSEWRSYVSRFGLTLSDDGS